MKLENELHDTWNVLTWCLYAETFLWCYYLAKVFTCASGISQVDYVTEHIHAPMRMNPWNCHEKLPWNTLSASDDACTKFIAIKMLFISHFFSHIFLNLRMKKRKWNCLKLDPPWPVAVCIMGAALWHYLTLIASHRSASALDTYQRVGGRAKLNSRWHGTSRSLRRGADAESAQSSWWSPAERVCMCDTEASWLHVHTVSVEAAEHRILKTDLIVL